MYSTSINSVTHSKLHSQNNTAIPNGKKQGKKGIVDINTKFCGKWRSGEVGGVKEKGREKRGSRDPADHWRTFTCLTHETCGGGKPSASQ